jgi:beta-phosphoglucomutase
MSKIDNRLLKEYSNEKEKNYRDICIEERMSLTHGAEEFIEYLVSRAININIATASEYKNTHFFIQKFSLKRTFDTDKIICDNGIVKSKPHPDYYNIAINTQGRDTASYAVIEDSIAGIYAAKNGDSGMIFMISSNQ